MQNASGHRIRFQIQLHAPPRSACRAIASPRVPPRMIISSIPAVTIPVAITSKIEIARTFQTGRVSSRS